MPIRPRPVLLDVTRLVSRVGGGPATGIDRVERAMLRALLEREHPLHGLCRTSGGFALLDRAGLESLARQLDGSLPWGSPDIIGLLSLRLPEVRRKAESAVRRLSSGRSGASGLGRLLGERLPARTAYLNVGHANLSDAVFDAVREVPGARTAVMIHDVIPLRLPWTQRRGASARFGEKLASVARHADVVFCPSAAEARHVADALRALDRAFLVVVAPLGIDRVACHPGPFLSGGLPPAPYFVAVGTMEPRKNLGLLLDVWEHLTSTLPPRDVPGLRLVGRRGWESPDFFRRLDSLKERVPGLHEFSDLPDEGRAALVSGARALLFPSRAEGYGLPPLEALSLGVTPVCAPLPVYSETVADAAVYGDPDDLYQWSRIVCDLARGGARDRPDWTAPSWEDHVNKVLSTIA